MFQQKTAPIQGEVDQCIDIATQFPDKKFKNLDDLVKRSVSLLICFMSENCLS